MVNDTPLEKLTGSLICPKIEGRRNAGGREFENALEMVKTGRAGGVIIFRGEKKESAGMIAELRRHAPSPIYVAADFENGAADQIDGATPLPSNMAIAASGDETLAFEKGKLTAMEARAIGVDVVFAPCVDVNTNPANPIIGVRSFGEDPETTGRFGAAMLRGLQAGGAADCIKHFPGHGDTSIDSHIDLPVLRFERKRLEETELAPFRDCIEAGSMAVMAGHIAVPALTGSDAVPATLSSEICTNLLRKEMNFQGVLFTDAMIMGALEKNFGEDEAVVKAVLAGCDVVLYPRNPERAYNALLGAVKNGKLPASRVEEAAGRVRKLVDWIADNNPRTTLSFAGSRTNVEAARRMARATITLVSDPGGILPLPSTDKTHFVIFDADESAGNGRGVFVYFMRKDLDPAFDNFGADADIGDERHVLRHAEKAGTVVALLFSEGRAWKGKAGLPENLSAILKNLAAKHPRFAAVSFGAPYMLEGLPESAALVAAYGPGPLAEEATAAALLGDAPITGRLPVTIVRGTHGAS